ncbi:hypothetical protein GPALN_005917 [Globodera pallida]|nr:hypothetical protein GPALN_005917 [Globodera pallida]
MFEAEKSNGTNVAALSPPAAYKVTAQSEKSALDALMVKVRASSYGQLRNYSTIDISAEKWLMHYDAASLAKLENPPSLADGISRELERDIRYLGCELIQSGAILLRLNQTAAATAQILFQRYYYLKSFVRYNFEHMVQACLLLASKIEEEPRKPRDVLNVYNRLKQIHHRRCAAAAIDQHPEAVQKLAKKFEHLELCSKKYQELKNIVIKAERRLLNVLGFVVHVHHPHKLIYIYLHILGQLKNDSKKHTEDEIRKSRQLLQKAWSYMNDGLRTDMFLRYTPETIACACIQLAVRTVDDTIVLPKEPFAWFELFDASDRDVRAISQMIWELHTRTKAPNLTWISDHLDRMYQKSVVEPEKARKEKAVEELRNIKEKILQRKAAQEIARKPPPSPPATKRHRQSPSDNNHHHHQRKKQQLEEERRTSSTAAQQNMPVLQDNRRQQQQSKKSSSPSSKRHSSSSSRKRDRAGVRDSRRRDDRGGDDHVYHDRR